MTAEGSRGRIRRRRVRRWTTAAALAPVAAMLVGSLHGSLGASGERQLACWVLPNARVLRAPGDVRCPLRSAEAIRRIEAPDGSRVNIRSSAAIRDALARGSDGLRVAIHRDAREVWFELPIEAVSRSTRIAQVVAAALLTGFLLGIPLFLTRSAPAPATPLLLFYCFVSIVVVTVISGRHSDAMTRASLVAMIFAPATLTHLAFTFPRERQVIREAPQLLAVPYGLAVVMIPVGWFAMDRDPLLWPPFMYLLLFLSAGAWIVLMTSCAYALRESASAMERARARVVFFGALLVPWAPALVLTGGRGMAELATGYLWSAAVAMPLPIALAISRYNLFDLGLDVRRAIGRVGYYGVAAGIVTVFVTGVLAASRSDPWPSWSILFATSFVCIAVVELLRGRTLGLLDSMLSPRRQELRRMLEDYEREVSRTREEEVVARRLGEVLRPALAPRSGCVLLDVAGEWVPSFAFGERTPARAALVADALAVLGERAVVYLELEVDTHTPHVSALRRAGVEIVAAVESAGERFGLVLLSPAARGTPYTGLDLDFLGGACSQAGIALRNARLTRDLLEREREATTGRVAVGLAHDLGKELDWMSRLVQRLPQRLDDRERLARDIGMIQEFTAEVVAGVRRFVVHATQPRPASPELGPFPELVDRAVARVSRIHGRDRVVQSVDPALKAVACHENLWRVLANLLDNALHASAEGEPVRLFATLDEAAGEIVAVVEDRGTGIPEALRSAVFDPGFSSRRGEGGSGIGLGVAREIVSDLGGTVELSSAPEGGTRAVVRIRARSGAEA